jgi:tetratricopeptide (TPR) repeat protein
VKSIRLALCIFVFAAAVRAAEPPLKPEEASRFLRDDDAGHFIVAAANGEQTVNVDQPNLDELYKLPKDQRIVLVDNGSGRAIETMTLLRLLGYQAFAARSAAPPAAMTSTASTASAAPANTATSTAADTRAGTPPETKLPPWAIWLFAVLGLASALMPLWFFVIQPRRRSRPLRDAVQLLAGGSDSALGDAELLLNAAVSAGLRTADLRQARFLLSYVRARIGRHSDALAVLGESIASGDESTDVLYLDLWLKVKSEQWEEAERRWYASSDVLGGVLQGKSLAGIVFLELGRQNLVRKEYDRALACFDKVRKLGVHLDRLPGHLSDLELVLAIGALFEKNNAQAKQRFENVFEKAKSAGAPTLLARLGLLLCRWLAEEQPDIEEPLAGIVAELEAAVSAGAGPESEEGALLPPVALWRVVSVLFRWLQLPKLKGVPARERERFDTLLEQVRKQMPNDGDADLIAGLLDYFCPRDEKQRRQGVETLRKAVEAGVTLPEVVYLLQCEDRLAEQEKNKVSTYLALVKGYLADPTVRIELRKELHEHLNRFERFRKLGDTVVPADESAAGPSVHELAASCQLVEERIRRIFRETAETEQQKEIETLLGNLTGSRDALQKTVNDLGTIEQQLMRTAGEVLLPDEPAAAGG